MKHWKVTAYHHGRMVYHCRFRRYHVARRMKYLIISHYPEIEEIYISPIYNPRRLCYTLNRCR